MKSLGSDNMNCLKCNLNPQLAGFTLCEECIKPMLPDSFHERRNDKKELETVTLTSSHRVDNLSRPEPLNEFKKDKICVQCKQVKRGTSKTQPIHYACFSDAKVTSWLWGFTIGLGLAIMVYLSLHLLYF